MAGFEIMVGGRERPEFFVICQKVPADDIPKEMSRGVPVEGSPEFLHLEIIATLPMLNVKNARLLAASDKLYIAAKRVLLGEGSLDELTDAVHQVEHGELPPVDGLNFVEGA